MIFISKFDNLIQDAFETALKDGKDTVILKLNYKCKKGTVDDTNRCTPEGESDSGEDSKTQEEPKKEKKLTKGQLKKIRVTTVNTPEFKSWFGKSTISEKDGSPMVVYHGSGSPGHNTFQTDTDRKIGMGNTLWGKNETTTLGAWFTDNPRTAESFSKSGYEKFVTRLEWNKDNVHVYDENAVKSGAIYPVYLSVQNPKVYEPKTKKVYAGKDHAGNVVEKDAIDDPFEQMMDDRDEFAVYAGNYGEDVKGKRGYWRQRMAAKDAEGTNKKFVAKLKAEGYDGIVIRKTDYDSPRKGVTVDQYVVFEPNQIKSVFNPKPTSSKVITNSKGIPEEYVPLVKQNYKCPENPPGSGNFKCDLPEDDEGGSGEGKKSTEKKGKRSGGGAHPSGYTPVKTRDDAETYAKNALLDPENVKRIEEWNKGANHKQYSLVKYRGVDLDVANEINESILENIQLGMKPLRTIESKSFKGKTFGAMMGSSGTLVLNTTNIGSKEKLMKNMETESKIYGEFGRNLMKQLEEHKDELTGPKKAKFEAFQEVFKYNRFVVAYDTASTIDHEMMHHFLNTGGGDYKSPERESFNKEWKDAADASLNSDWKYKISVYGGGAHAPGDPFALYGFDRRAEHMCESYAAWRQGEEVHPQVAAFFEKNLSGASKRDSFVRKDTLKSSPPAPKKTRKTKKSVERGNIVDRIKKVTGTDDVNMTRINSKDAEVIASVLEDEQKFIPFRLSKITNSSGIRGAWMSMTPAGELGISATHVKDQADKKLASWDDYISMYGDAIQSLEKQRSEPGNEPELNRRISKVIREYDYEKRKYEGKRDSGKKFIPVVVPYLFEGDDRTRAVLIHEIGHDRWNHALSKTDKDEINAAYKDAYKRGDHVSEHGMSTSNEWWSEHYALHRMGKPCDPVVKKVISRIRR